MHARAQDLGSSSTMSLNDTGPGNISCWCVSGTVPSTWQLSDTCSVNEKCGFSSAGYRCRNALASWMLSTLLLYWSAPHGLTSLKAVAPGASHVCSMTCESVVAPW